MSEILVTSNIEKLWKTICGHCGHCNSDKIYFICKYLHENPEIHTEKNYQRVLDLK